MGFRIRRNYPENTVCDIVNFVKECISEENKNNTHTDSEYYADIFFELMSKTDLIISGKCYVGISANPVQSLAAHGIDINEENTFFCMDIPSEKAGECKKAITELNGYTPITDPENDYIDDTYDQTYIYIYKISEKTNEKISINDFTPLKKLPERAIAIEKTYTDGSYDKKYCEDGCPKEKIEAAIDKIMEEISENRLTKINITHSMLNRLYAEFGENCCIINYDNGTSQSGGYQSYRSGEKARKKVRLFTGEYPEYMLCRDMTVFKDILTYFIFKGKKPGKRQNIKWVNMKDE